MIELLQMWAFVEALGIVCLPLTSTVFHNLPDRGWTFSKAIGIALLAFCVWLPLMVVHTLPFSQAFIAGVVLILLAFNILGFVHVRRELMKLLRVNLVYIVASEVVFLGMVFLLGWIRSYGPDIRSFEMFMDEGFIAAILRSPHFPPNDMWFSGFPINYYYYAHYTIAVLAKLLGQPPSIAFNTGICIFFGLTAVNLFGVTCNIVSWACYQRTKTNVAAERADTVHPSLLRAIPYGFMTMLMALVLGNLAATQQWWKNHGDWTQFDWFAPSRVVDKTINEFPAFSFLLSCFHAHVLTLAFTIAAIGLALNLFLEHEGKGLHIFGRGWRLPLTLGTTALILGGLFTMNGWDFPTYLGLALICIALQQWLAYEKRFRFELLLDFFTAGSGLASISFLVYAPFYLNFISPSQGLGIVGPTDRSQLGQEVLIYGLFAFVFLSVLFICLLKRRLIDKGKAEVKTADDAEVEAADEENQEEEMPEVTQSDWRRWLDMRVVGIVVVAIAGLFALLLMKNSTTFVVTGTIAAIAALLVFYHLDDRARAFTLLLGGIGFGLVAVCEVFYLKDVFADSYPRMNTVFKFYFQSWALLSIACGAGIYFVLEGFRPAATSKVQVLVQRGGGLLWGTLLLLLLLAGMVYPLVGTYARTDHYAQRTNSLDGLNYLQSYNLGDYTAIRWLNSHVSGDPVIVEAIGPDYSDYARVSAFTGLPTPMGWVGHEYQWRVNWLNRAFNSVEFNRRSADIDSIYTDTRPAVVLSLMLRYQAQYLYVGPLEQAKYPNTNLHRFSAFMKVVYSAYGVTIYQVE